MNEQERAELEGLKQRQARLLAQLTDLGKELAAFENRLTQAEDVAQSTESVSVPAPVPPLIPPVAKPPPLPPGFEQKPVEPPRPAPQPVPMAPLPATPRPAPTPQAAAPSQPPPPRREEPVFTRQTATPEPPKPSPTPKPQPKSSFELRLGTFWLVRIGIVMLLTGLVFFGTYAYHNYVGKLGPGGKLSLLYLVSGGLIAIGAWLQRKDKLLKNYSQVLVAGGLAAVYFTTYAAHYVPQLEVITSPLIDGLLLLGWAGIIIWLANRTKSEVLALFAVLLAYYSSIITHFGLFTLYSNLVLTLAAVLFLVRNRWATLSFASLAATYVSYAFWRFYPDGHWQLAAPEQGLWTGNYFLMGYWLLFTAAVFLSRHEQFSGGRRASFLSLNNGAFFGAFILTMWQVHQGGFWKFSLIYGSILIGLAILARRLLPTDKTASNSYLTQGLLLVTLGFLTYYTGLKLSLVLGVESVILLILGRQLKSPILQAGSFVAAFLATVWGVKTIEPLDHNGLLMGSALGALMLFNAFWSRRDTTFEKSTGHPSTLFFTTLSLGLWFVTTSQNTTAEQRGLLFAVESVAFLLLAKPLGNRALKVGSCLFAVAAVGWEVPKLLLEMASHALDARVGLPQGIAIGALMIFNALWEIRQSTPAKDRVFYPPATFFSALGLLVWLASTCVFTSPDYLAPALAIEALLLTAGYYVLRLAELSVFGQGFLLFAQTIWLADSIAAKAVRPWWNPVLVIAATLALAQWWQRQKALILKREIGEVLQGIYALAIVGLLYFWLQPQFTAPSWLAFSALLALLLTAYAALNRYWLLAAAGQLFLVVSGSLFVSQLRDGKPEWYLPLLPIFALGLLSFSAIKWFERRPEASAQVREPILQIGLVYRVVAVIMSLWWVHKYIPARENVWVFALLGMLLFLLAGWRRNLEWLIYSAAFTFAGLIKFWLPLEDVPSVYWPNLIALILLLAQQRLARRSPDNYRLPRPVQGGMIILGSLSIWLYVSRWILQGAGGFYLTAGWAALALVFFIIGISLRERVYRWLGLAVLGCALGRVAIFDLRKLETIYQILSFMALGIVLLVLGFIYNKYQDKIKEWL